MKYQLNMLENKAKSNIHPTFLKESAKKLSLFWGKLSQLDMSLIIYHLFDSNAPFLDGAW